MWFPILDSKPIDFNSPSSCVQMYVMSVFSKCLLIFCGKEYFNYRMNSFERSEILCKFYFFINNIPNLF